MTQRSAKLHLEILCYYGLTSDSQFETSILQRTAIAPVIGDTSHRIIEILQCQQVCCTMLIIVKVNTQTVVQEISLKTNIEFAGLLPRNLFVTNVIELCGSSLPQILTNGE